MSSFARDPETAKQPPAHGERLPRKLGATTLTLIYINFSAPLAVLAGYQQLVVAFGNGVGAPVMSLVAGVVLILFAVGAMAMSRQMSSPGPFYTSISEGLGKPAGLSGAFVAIAAYLTITVSSYPYAGLAMVNLMNQFFGNQVLTWQIWGALVLALVTVLNILRVDVSMKVLFTVIGIEIVAVIAWQIAVFATGGPEGYSTQSFHLDTILSGNLGLALLFSVSGLIGLESTSVFREETRDPEKNVPRATYAAITSMAVFYGLGIWAYIIAIGPSKAVEAARTDPVGSFFGSVTDYLGPTVSAIVSVLLVTSEIAALNSAQGATVRYLYTMGKDRVLWSRLARVHPRLQSPHVAVLVTAGVIAVAYLALSLAGDDGVLAYGALGGFGTLCLLVLLLGTCFAVIAFFRRNPGTESVWRSLIAPVLALIGIGTMVLLAVTNMEVLVGDPTLANVAVILIVVVMIVGFLLALRFRTTRPDVYERIGRDPDAE